jgi:hypothetical protein
MHNGECGGQQDLQVKTIVQERMLCKPSTAESMLFSVARGVNNPVYQCRIKSNVNSFSEYLVRW